MSRFLYFLVPLSPIIAEIISRVLMPSSFWLILPLFNMLLISSPLTKGYRNTNLRLKLLVFIFLISIVIISQIFLSSPHSLITFYVDLTVVVLFLYVCLIAGISLDQYKVNYINKGLLVSVIITFIGVILSILYLNGLTYVEFLVKPKEHAVRYLGTGELDLISSFFSSSKQLGRFSISLLFITILFYTGKSIKIIIAILLFCVFASGARESIYLSFIILLIYNFKKYSYVKSFVFASISISVVLLLVLFFYDYSFLFSEENFNLSLRTGSILSLILNYDIVVPSGLGNTGRSLLSIGVDNISGVLPITVRGTAHDSVVSWLLVSFGVSGLLLFFIIIISLFAFGLLRKNYTYLLGLLVIVVLLLKSQGLLYDPFTLFSFLVLSKVNFKPLAANSECNT